MEQSEIAIIKTIELMEEFNMFKNLTESEITKILQSLNKISLSGYQDARSSFNI